MIAGLALSCARADGGEQRSSSEWITLGDAVHGGFGSHIALGIRIGEDALKRLGISRHEVNVVVTEGRDAPCACIADGVMIATSASPGQRTLSVLPKSADASFLAVVEVTSRKTGDTVRYRIPASAILPLAMMNPQKTAQERYDLVMTAPAEQLYAVTSNK
jgi:formylmethanofuran dehydrogenase subunit E